MSIDMIFIDKKRQSEVYGFYESCQMQRNYYRGYPESKHPLDFYKKKPYSWQSPPELTGTYLNFPFYHVQYKNPPSLLKKENNDTSFTARYSKDPAVDWKR